MPEKKGSKYSFQYWDGFLQKWRDGILCESYRECMNDRSQYLICLAMGFLKIEHNMVYEGGEWKQYIIHHEKLNVI